MLALSEGSGVSHPSTLAGEGKTGLSIELEPMENQKISYQTYSLQGERGPLYRKTKHHTYLFYKKPKKGKINYIKIHSTSILLLICSWKRVNLMICYEKCATWTAPESVQNYLMNVHRGNDLC